MSNYPISEEPSIKREEISNNKYTLSLLNQGLHKGLIHHQFVEKFHLGSMDILKRLIIKFTFGESSSVKVETAENILLSIFYCIDSYMASLKVPEEGIAILEEVGLEEVYTRGIDEVKLCLESCKILFEAVKKSKLDTQLQAYNDTIDKAIPDFLVWYNPLFNAHDTMCSIDYPLSSDDMSIQGVFYIKQYLEQLNLETIFCHYFDNQEIKELLENYGTVYKLDYREQLINVFEIVFSNYFFGLLAGNSDKKLHITDSQYDILTSTLNKLSLNEIREVMNNNYEQLITSLELEDKKLTRYINEYKPIFTQRVMCNIKDGSLNYMIITDQIENTQDVLVLDTDNKMDDEDFKELVNRIIDCTQVQDKLMLISIHIKSLVDFIDILKANCLFEEEHDYVLDTLDDMELAIIGKIIYAQEIRFSEIKLTEIETKQLEEEWEVYYHEYINNLEDERIENIEHLIKTSNIKI